MRDIETVTRGFLRKVGYARDRSSYPFVSGDTYKWLCDEIIEDPHDFLNRLLHKDIEDIRYFISGFDAIVLAELIESHSISSKVSGTLVIHNWDNIPSHSQMASLKAVFVEIYSVNWLGDRGICSPIPIGLENLDLWRNGVPRDFRRQIEWSSKAFDARRIEVLCSFTADTNPPIRNDALNFFSKIEGVVMQTEFSSPKRYRKTLLDSKFVISPPGNGADCHRTWEAIYSGAIPVVLRDYWPFAHLNLPVIVIDSWRDSLTAIESFVPIRFDSIVDLEKMFLQDFFNPSLFDK
jgi:hypothetical protein